MANSRKKIRHNLNDHDNCTTKISSTHNVALRSRSQERVRNPPPRTPSLSASAGAKNHSHRLSTDTAQPGPPHVPLMPSATGAGEPLKTTSPAIGSIRRSSAQRATYIVPSCPNRPAGPQSAACSSPPSPQPRPTPQRHSFLQLPAPYTVSGRTRRWMANSGSSFLKSKGL